MSRVWNREGSYWEGERVRHNGKSYDAKMDVCRGITPGAPGNGAFWRVVPTIAPAAKHKPTSRPAPRGMLTRDMTIESRRPR